MARTISRVTPAKAAVKKATPTKATTVKRTPTPKAKVEEITAKIATIPDKKYLDGYVPRKIGNLTEFEIFEAAYRLKHNVLIEGPTGTGKTSSILAYAAHKNLPFYSVSSSSGTEPTQLFGKYIPDGSGGFVWQDGAVTDLVRHGGVLLINEVNFIPDRVKTVLFGLLDRRRKIELLDHQSEVIYAPDNFIVFADMNPDYEGTRPLNKAFRNRFATQLFFDYDAKIESKLVGSKALLDVAKQLRDQIAQGLYDTPVSTNMLIEFEDIANELDVAFAVSNFINHFPQDDRASIKQVLDTWQSNIEASFKKSKSSTTTTVVEDEEEEDGFFTLLELDGMTLRQLRKHAYETGIAKADVDSMDLEELRKYLTGDHPLWSENADWDTDVDWSYEEA